MLIYNESLSLQFNDMRNDGPWVFFIYFDILVLKNNYRVRGENYIIK